ncbi:hypothetical protein [Nocardia brasiliensis]|uniref:hypothetical protein n=1 Tax=Nocardia brasiliensis TaxID=37326 RepID=UPI003D91C926
MALSWIGSLILVAVLAFRLGYWWKMTELQGRHAAGNMALHREWDGDAEFADDDDQSDVSDGEPADDGFGDTPLPAEPKALHSYWINDDTEVLPRIQDIQPPIRPTPIRRPPWVGDDRQAEKEDARTRHGEA